MFFFNFWKKKNLGPFGNSGGGGRFLGGPKPLFFKKTKREKLTGGFFFFWLKRIFLSWGSYLNFSLSFLGLFFFKKGRGGAFFSLCPKEKGGKPKPGFFLLIGGNGQTHFFKWRFFLNVLGPFFFLNVSF